MALFNLAAMLGRLWSYSTKSSGTGEKTN